jgi:hypothetical protein
MATHQNGLSPYADVLAEQVLWDAIIAFWNEIRVTEDTGVTTWETLEPLERLVTECRNQDPPDLGRAMSLTRKAQLLIAGLDDL